MSKFETLREGVRTTAQVVLILFAGMVGIVALLALVTMKRQIENRHEWQLMELQREQREREQEAEPRPVIIDMRNQETRP